MINDQAIINVHCKCKKEFQHINTQMDDDDSEFAVASLWAMLTIRAKHKSGDGCDKGTAAAWVIWPNGSTTHLDLQEGGLLETPA